MKALVLYDSNFGNTEIIAKAIAESLEGEAKHIRSVTTGDLVGLQLLVVGSPINAWSPTPAVKTFVQGLPSLSGIKIAAFDTRIKTFFSGNAAKKIARWLLRKGGVAVSSPQGFYVTGKEGPLAPGERERAILWANTLNA
jgi:flavodoxin